MSADLKPFLGQAMIVTGAGGGLGKAYALLLASLGAAVVVNDLGTSSAGSGADPAPARQVVEQIQHEGGIAIAVTDSVTTPAGGRAIVEAALDNFGRLDGLINNAGSLRSASLEDTTDENLDAMIDVHLKGAFHLTRPAFRAMKDRSYGRILFTASSGGVFGSEGNAAYGAAKTGLLGLMNVAAIEGEPHGILSNALMPASVTRLAEQGVSSYLNRIQKAAVAMGAERAGAIDPAFVAPLAAYLVSPKCTSTHAIYTSVMGRYARVFVGLGPGWFGPTAEPASIEEVGAHFADIRETAPFTIPEHLAEEFEGIARTLSNA